MSQPSVPDIAAALGAALGTISGLRIVEWLSDSFSPPAALIGIDTINYHGAFGGGDVEHFFTVYVVVCRASDRAGLTLMENYMSQAGTGSVKAALEADPTLGGVVSGLSVTKAGPPSAISIGAAEYVSVPFEVEVHA